MFFRLWWLDYERNQHLRRQHAVLGHAVPFSCFQLRNDPWETASNRMHWAGFTLTISSLQQLSLRCGVEKWVFCNEWATMNRIKTYLLENASNKDRVSEPWCFERLLVDVIPIVSALVPTRKMDITRVLKSSLSLPICSANLQTALIRVLWLWTVGTYTAHWENEWTGKRPKLGWNHCPLCSSSHRSQKVGQACNKAIMTAGGRDWPAVILTNYTPCQGYAAQEHGFSFPWPSSKRT